MKTILLFALAAFVGSTAWGQPNGGRDYSYSRTAESSEPAAVPVSDPPASKTASPATTSAPTTKGKPLTEETAALSYTYTNDRRYHAIQEMIGEEFIPAEYQLGQAQNQDLTAGKVRIVVQPQQIIVQGIDALQPGIFQILTKSSEKVGFIYEMMDMNGKPARFKVVTDQNGYVSLLYLYSKTLGEHTFYLAEKTDAQLAVEQSFFTAKSKYFIRTYGMLVDKEIHPYTMIKDMSVDNTPLVLKSSDNVTIKFTETAVSLPTGTFEVKQASTYVYALDGFPSVRSMVEIKTKGREEIYVFLNFKQEIEFIQHRNTRYFLMP